MAWGYAYKLETIQNSIRRLKKLEKDLSQDDDIGFTKKEILKLTTEKDKLKRSLGGIADMKVVPNMLFIIDTNIESIAVKEAIKLNIPIVAILDSNSDPTGINHPIPGNDDARRSINLYCEILKDTIVDAKKYISKKTAETKILKDKNDVSNGKSTTVDKKVENKDLKKKN